MPFWLKSKLRSQKTAVLLFQIFEQWSLMAAVMVGGHNRPMLRGRPQCSAHDLPLIRLQLLLLLLPAMFHPVDGLLVPPRSGLRSLMLGTLPRAMFQELKLHRPGS